MRFGYFQGELGEEGPKQTGFLKYLFGAFLSGYALLNKNKIKF